MTHPRVIKCTYCKEIVERAPCHTKTGNVYCNRLCYLNAVRKDPKLSSNWKGKGIHFNCIVCQTPCTSRIQGNKRPKYCSLQCAGIDRGKKQQGNKHWNWKGGNNSRYIKKIAPRPRPEQCEICKSYGGKRNGIVLDHNHKAGKFRGRVCSNCNTIIGLAYENTNTLKLIINYINENPL